MNSSSVGPADLAHPKLPLPRLFGLIALSFGLTLVSSTLDPAILGHKILAWQLANDSQTGSTTLYGTLTFAGLLVAGLTQPIAGRLSDHAQSRGYGRIPFLLGGSALTVLGLLLIASASGFVPLLLSLLVLQIGFNSALSPWQSLTPAHVPARQRGFAAGIKAMYDLLAAIVGRVAAGALMAQIPAWGQAALWWMVAVPAVGLLTSLLLTVLSQRHLPKVSLSHSHSSATPSIHPPVTSLSLPLRWRNFWRELPLDFKWWFVNRFFFWCAFIGSSTFLLFVSIDVLGMTEPIAQAFIGRLTAVLGVALLLVILPAGWLADRVGRLPFIIIGGVLASLGTLGVALTRDLNLLIACAMVIGIGVGLYLSGSVAQLTDIVPHAKAAQYLGLANIATAGGSAIARLGGGVLVDVINQSAHTRDLGYITVYSVASVFFLASAAVWGWRWVQRPRI